MELLTADSALLSNPQVDTPFSTTSVIPAGTLRAGEAYRWTARLVYNAVEDSCDIRMRTSAGATRELCATMDNELLKKVGERNAILHAYLVCTRGGKQGEASVNMWTETGYGQSFASQTTARQPFDTTVENRISWTFRFRTPHTDHRVLMRDLITEQLVAAP